MTIRLDIRDRCAVLTLDRPPVNALDLPSVLEFERVLAELPRDRSLVITGAGGAFSAGVDTRFFAAARDTDREAQVLAITRVTARLLSLPVPVVAAVNGHAMGGGFVLMLCADYRIAAADDTMKFGLTEAPAGVPFPIGPTEVIRAEVPAPLLRRLGLTSAVVGLRDLLAAGVVDEHCGREEVLDRAADAAIEMAAQPAFAVVKAQIRGPLRAALAAAVASGGDPHLGAFTD